MGQMPAAAAFSYGQRSRCADLSELLQFYRKKTQSQILGIAFQFVLVYNSVPETTLLFATG